MGHRDCGVRDKSHRLAVNGALSILKTFGYINLLMYLSGPIIGTK